MSLNAFAQQVGTDVKALRYDSGLRSLNSLIANRSSGDLTISRIGNTVTMSANGLTMSNSASGSLLPSALPVGWRPTATASVPAQGLSSRLQVTNAGNVQAYNWAAGTPIYGTVTFVVRDAVAGLPGTPA